MKMNYEDMTFTESEREKLKENKKMIIDWITENIILYMNENSSIKCDFGGIHQCPRSSAKVDNYHFYVFSESREFHSGGGKTTEGKIGYGQKFGYINESFESVNSPYDIYIKSSH